MRKIRDLLNAALLSLIFLVGCSEEDQTARLRITLIDSPGDYDKVNVDIQGVSVHTNSMANEDDGGWVFLENSAVGVKNLLDYTAGTELTLVDTDFPTGMISQIRLHLGENNSVTIDKDDLPLETPSAQQSGLKLQVHENLDGGITYNFKLDFEAAKSVVHNGSDEYILKPVIKVITEAMSGAIKGEVFPASENVAIYIIEEDDTISTTYAPVDISDFLAPGIPEGQYLVGLDPGEGSTYSSTTIEDVLVSNGEVTDLGITDLSQE